MRTLIIASAWGSPLLFIALLPRAPVAGFLIMAATHAVLLYATLAPNVQWLGPVITRFETRSDEVWLTIDDGPTEDTFAILDLLEEHDVQATFFVKGALATARPDLVRAIVKRGHTVGNHSHTHPSATFWCLSGRSIGRELDRCSEALQSALGAAPRWFRAPVGMKNPAVHPQLDRRGLRLIGWSARGFDGVRADLARVEHRIMRRLEPGAILVLHQGRDGSRATIERVVQAVKSRGYSFVVPADERLKTSR